MILRFLCDRVYLVDRNVGSAIAKRGRLRGVSARVARSARCEGRGWCSLTCTYCNVCTFEKCTDHVHLVGGARITIGLNETASEESEAGAAAAVPVCGLFACLRELHDSLHNVGPLSTVTSCQ